MHQSLLLQPIHLSSVDILKRFTLGEPLTNEQMQLLYSQQKQLSSKDFDPIYEYYIDSAKKRHAYTKSFLLTEEELTPKTVQQLKKRLPIFLQPKRAKLVLKCTHKQFLQFRALTVGELVFWHGNQALTGAPYFPGGIPPVLFFQWGNYFGVVKYVILAGEKVFKGNVLIYFEDKEERLLDQCVEGYYQALKHEREDQKKLICKYDMDSKLTEHFIIKPPTPFPRGWHHEGRD